MDNLPISFNDQQWVHEHTLRLPQHEQGVSMLESSSSSWHILHSTIFFGDGILSNSISGEDLPLFKPSMAEEVASVDCFRLSIAASNVDSVNNRSTSKTKWSPILKNSQYQEKMISQSLNWPNTIDIWETKPWFFPTNGLCSRTQVSKD